MSEVDKIQIQTTSVCNGDCVFCPYSESWHKNNPGKMKLGLYKKLLVDMEDLPELRTLCPYFENEPTMDKRVFDWIEMFYEKFPDKTVELSINAGDLTKSVQNKMLKVFKDREHYIPVSFHGINEGTYEYIMRLPWKRSLKNLISLIKKSEGNYNIMIRGGGHSLDNQITYFTDGHYVGFWQEVCKEYDIDPSILHIQPFAFHDRAGQIDRDERFAKKNRYGVVRPIDNDHPFDCVRFDKVFHVLWNGDISACCMDYKKEIDWLGNINDMSIIEYYNSESFNMWKSMGIGKIETDANFICKRCVSPGG